MIAILTVYLNINLHGYSFLHHDSETKAGGVAFYIKKSLSFTRRNNIKVELPLVEDKWIEIKTISGPVVVGIVYRLPINFTFDCEKLSENLFKFFLSSISKISPFIFLEILILTYTKWGRATLSQNMFTIY